MFFEHFLDSSNPNGMAETDERKKICRTPAPAKKISP
jgi:hypothetical protein